MVRDGAARGRRPLLRRRRRRRRTARSPCSSSSRPSARASIRSRARSSGRVRTSSRRSSRSGASAPGASAAVKRVVEGAFAHRRKTLANSLALAGVASRERAVAALDAIGRDAGRPRRGARAAASSSRSPRRSRDRPAPAKINLALVVGPLRDGRQARGRDRLPARRPRRPRRRSSRADELVGRRLRRRHDRPARARAARAAHGWRVAHREAHPGRGGPRRRQLRRRRPRFGSRTRCSPSRSPHERAPRARRAARRRRAVLPARRAAARHRRRHGARAARPAAGLRRAAAPAARRVEAVDRRGLRRVRRARRRRGFDERAAALRAALAAVGGRATSPRCRRTTSRRSPLAERLRAAARSAPTSAAPARPCTGSSTRAPTRARAAPRCGASARPGSRTCVVRLMRMFGAHAIEHGSTRTGRWLRERRLRFTLWIAAIEGLLYLFARPPLVGGRRARGHRRRLLVVRRARQPLGHGARAGVDLRRLAAARPLCSDRARDRRRRSRSA